MGTDRGHRVRWAAAATIGPWLVLVLLGCGGFELTLRARRWPASVTVIAPLFPAALSGGILLSVAWGRCRSGAAS